MVRGFPAVLAALALLGSTLPAAGQGPVRTPRVHALTGARIVVAPGRVIDPGTLVIRDGVIEAVGARVTIPPDARIWAADSLTLYPGLIDPVMSASPAGEEKAGEEGGGRDAAASESAGGIHHELSVVTPELILADRFQLKSSDRDARRAQGITTVRAVPDKGVFRGRAAILNLGDGDLGRNLLRRDAGQVLSFETAAGDRYPNSIMGSVAVLRQTLIDARWYAEATAAYAARPVGVERPEVNAALEALGPAVAGKEPWIFVTDDVLDVLRAQALEREFELEFELAGSGEEYKRLDEIAAGLHGLSVPVNYPEPPGVGSPGDALGVTQETLRHWEAAPRNPARLHEAKAVFALTAHGLKDVGRFRKNVGKAMAAGLPEDVALAAATTVPARMLGLADRLGTLETGKIANLVVTDGPIFSDSTKVRAVWIDGERYEIEDVKPPQGDPRGTWEITGVLEEEPYPFQLVIGGDPGALTGKLSIFGQELDASVSQSGATLTVTFKGDAIEVPGVIQFTMALAGDEVTGAGSSSAGEFTLSGKRTAKPEGPKQSDEGSGRGGAR